MRGRWLPASLLLLLASGAAGADTAAGRASCVPCHRAICDTYSRTPMALTSGAVLPAANAAGSLARSSFQHPASGVRYRLESAGSSLWLGIEKEADLRVRRRLPYYVGSGQAARSYLLEQDGYLFEAPVALYAAGPHWDLAPGYGQYAYPFLARSVQPGCLNCHATGLNPVAGTQNRFQSPPFREAGIGCERCHGPGDKHIAQMRTAAPSGPSIINPARLPADRRDSVCQQCHLQGEVRVLRPGRDWSSFQPGGRLADVMTVFVRSGAPPAMKVTSHGELLALSRCRQAAGDRLWCGSCHDPHAVPAAGERAAWFRARCLVCHQSTAPCTAPQASRAAQGDDCTACHMPKRAVTDAQHVAYTDHSIPRRPRGPVATAAVSPKETADLVPFQGMAATARDTALAYAIDASRARTPASQSRALTLLPPVLQQQPDDVEVLAYLAELYRNTGQSERAAPLYRRILTLAPGHVTASTGLGAIQAERGDDRGAIALWEVALAGNPGLLLVRTNLAAAYARLGDKGRAQAVLRDTLDLNPGFPPAVDLLQRLSK